MGITAYLSVMDWCYYSILELTMVVCSYTVIALKAFAVLTKSKNSNMNYLLNYCLSGKSCPANLKNLLLHLIFTLFISGVGLSQASTIKNEVNPQNQVLVLQNEVLSPSDSIKKLEARRLYVIPVATLKENEEKTKVNQPQITTIIK